MKSLVTINCTVIQLWTGNTTTNDSSLTDDEATAAEIEDIGYVYVTPLICVIGVIFNALNLLVLCQLKGSSYTYFTALSIADGLSLLMLTPIGLSRCRTCLDDSSAYVRLLMEVYAILPLSNIFATWSVWITVALTVERYLLTRHPYEGRKTERNVRIAKKTVVVLAVLAVAFNLPYFFQSSVVGNKKVQTAFSQTIYYRVYGWSKAIFVRYLPIVILTLMNILLMLIVKGLDKKRHLMVYNTAKSVKRQLAQRRLTVTLISIVFTFLIGNIPISFAHPVLYRAISGPGSLKTLTYKTFRLVANLLELINFASNFILYCILNKRFMDTLMKMFCKPYQKCSRRANRDSATGQSIAMDSCISQGASDDV